VWKAHEVTHLSRRNILQGISAGVIVGVSVPIRSELHDGHVVLIGDSVFDNAAYVRSGKDVPALLKGVLPKTWEVTLKAVDGATTLSVPHQLTNLPKNVTHIIVSAGGNDALHQKSFVSEDAYSVAEVLGRLAQIRTAFRHSYRTMVNEVLAQGIPTAVCTIYNSRFSDLTEREACNAGLTIFNDVIVEEAVMRELPVIDLRTIFHSDDDYVNAVE
jgi:hypothetical protein